MFLLYIYSAYIEGGKSWNLGNAMTPNKIFTTACNQVVYRTMFETQTLDLFSLQSRSVANFGSNNPEAVFLCPASCP